MLPLKLYLHDPLATVHSYGVLAGEFFSRRVWHSVSRDHRGHPVSPPLDEFCHHVRMDPACARRKYRHGLDERISRATPENMSRKPSSSGYIYFSSTLYNAPRLARGNFRRFAIPILPFVFLALLRWLPKDRRLLWCAAVIAAPLAAFSAIGIQNIGLP